MLDHFEEYDGINHEQAKQFVFVVSLPLLVRGHAVSVKVLEDIVSIRVPTLYKLQLGLPKQVEADAANAFFDCKARKLFLVMPVVEPEPVELFEPVAAAQPAEEKTEKPVDVKEMKIEPLQESNQPVDDLLFDVV